jgi:hypothetical protein
MERGESDVLKPAGVRRNDNVKATQFKRKSKGKMPG